MVTISIIKIVRTVYTQSCHSFHYCFRLKDILAAELIALTFHSGMNKLFVPISMTSIFTVECFENNAHQCQTRVSLCRIALIWAFRNDNNILDLAWMTGLALTYIEKFNKKAGYIGLNLRVVPLQKIKKYFFVVLLENAQYSDFVYKSSKHDQLIRAARRSRSKLIACFGISNTRIFEK